MREYKLEGVGWNLDIVKTYATWQEFAGDQNLSHLYEGREDREALMKKVHAESKKA